MISRKVELKFLLQSSRTKKNIQVNTQEQVEMFFWLENLTWVQIFLQENAFL